MTSRWDQARDRNETVVAERAERLLSDDRFPGLRTRRGRVGLVVAQGTAIVLTPLVWIFAGAIPGLAVVIVAMLLLVLLRMSVRVVADLPDHVLDERLLATRNAAYVDAFRYLAGLLVVLASVGLFAFVVNANDADVWTVELTWDWVMGGFWILWLLALSLPSMTLALQSDPDVPVDPEG